MQVGVLEAKNRFSELLEKVAAGEEVVITKRGGAIARLVPVERKASEQEVARLISQADRLRASAGFATNWERNKQDRDEGRRF